MEVIKRTPPSPVFELVLPSGSSTYDLYRCLSEMHGQDSLKKVYVVSSTGEIILVYSKGE